MYQNVGKRIMILAKICGWLWMIAGVAVWIYFLTNGNYIGPDRIFLHDISDNFIGWIGLAVGVMGVVFTWPMYGFGQIVDDVRAMRRHAEAEAKPAAQEEK